MHNNKVYNFNCRVCGLNQGFAPWGNDRQTSSFFICPCCRGEVRYSGDHADFIPQKDHPIILAEIETAFQILFSQLC